jgi:hypothetical protein
MPLPCRVRPMKTTGPVTLSGSVSPGFCTSTRKTPSEPWRQARSDIEAGQGPRRALEYGRAGARFCLEYPDCHPMMHRDPRVYRPVLSFKPFDPPASIVLPLAPGTRPPGCIRVHLRLPRLQANYILSLLNVHVSGPNAISRSPRVPVICPVPRSLSDLGLIYCAGGTAVHFPDPFRQIATAILLKRSKNGLALPLGSLRSPKSDRLLGKICIGHAILGRRDSRTRRFRYRRPRRSVSNLSGTCT